MSDASRQFTAMVLEPEHFHAALLFNRPNRRLSAEVHVYTRGGDGSAQFCDLLTRFNEAHDSATDWRLHVHRSLQPLEALLESPHGDFAVLAGRNDVKLERIAALHAAGIAVLADKPWLVDVQCLPLLERICSSAPLAMDMMTSRHDPLARLRRRIVRSSSLFGDLETNDSEGPAIEIGSSHHLVKRVNGEPLRRPPWYYDIRVQGDGITDIQAHMIDQVQWLTDRGEPRRLEDDVQLDSTRRWVTEVPLALYRESTGEEAFAAALVDSVVGDVLALNANGRIDFEMSGISARTHAEWRQREPEGGGDLHHSIVRGRRADVILRQSAGTQFQPKLLYRPRHANELQQLLDEALIAWQEDFPAIRTVPSKSGIEVQVDDSRALAHESHFAPLMDTFLGHLEGGEWPQHLAAETRLRYSLLGHASLLARDSMGDASTID